jgi:hypothetical protein
MKPAPNIRLNSLFIAILLVFMTLLQETQAQRWKSYRYELQVGLGMTNFLGELGGADQIGTNYFRDLEFSQTRQAASIGLRYKINEFFAARTNFFYGMVSGNDNLTEEEFRNYRNLSFRSNIFEWSNVFEASFMREQLGHRYRLKGVKGQRAFEVYTYGFVGFGFFYFNPQGYFPEKESWVDLRPLGTEGQGLVPTRKKYSLFQFCIPIGLGFKYSINRTWGFGVEYGIRKTFTDYIDDVSTTYFDPKIIRTQYGSTAEFFSNRGNNDDPYSPTASKPGTTRAGQQRGDPRDHDSYMFLTFSVNYKLKTGRNNLPKF